MTNVPYNFHDLYFLSKFLATLQFINTEKNYLIKLIVILNNITIRNYYVIDYEDSSQIYRAFFDFVTAIGLVKVKMQETKDYYEDRKLCRRLVGLRALATVKDQPRRGRGLDPDREKTCHWSRQGGRFTAKKNESQKVSFELRRGSERSPFHVVRWKVKF